MVGESSNTEFGFQKGVTCYINSLLPGLFFILGCHLAFQVLLGFVCFRIHDWESLHFEYKSILNSSQPQVSTVLERCTTSVFLVLVSGF
jgi:hypothetical protein